MAEVWLGADEVLGRQVAVKLLHPNLATDDTFVHRLRREAVQVARINHPGIVAVYDTVSDGGYEAVVMEYVPGLTLRQVLDEQPQLEVDEVVRIGIALADALDAAHAAGIVHRDVKPGNVLITPEGRVRLTDFGIATAMLAADELGDDGVLLGTAKYVAPEQVQGHLVDGRTDLYSLAIVLTECLTGHVPFDGPNERAVALARLRQVPAPVRRARPDVPVALDELLAAALSPRPYDRPATAAAFRDALQRIPKAAVPEVTVATDGDATAALPDDHTRPYPADPTTRADAGMVAVAGATADAPVAMQQGDPTPVGRAGSHQADGYGADSHRVEVAAASEVLLRTDQRLVGWVVAVLVAVAIIVGLVLVAMSRTSKPGAAPALTPVTTARPRSLAGAAGTTVAPAAPARQTNAMQIVGAGEFDPRPGDGEEHPEQIGLLTDGRTNTFWTTVCYRRANMAPKEGVGVVLQLSAPAKGHTLVLTTPSRGFSASTYVASSVGDRLRDWGRPTDQANDLGPGDVELDLGNGTGRYVLVWFTVLGQPGCSTMPYQVRVAEVNVVRG